ncbi:unnamed protein product [Chondrus crispus]|uniref:Uncharacterized protein n=1 Tax=Chondrus crispus TaxID=2769 RepID=R7Q6Q8_CHOCR|nr:unnamed protein product [Chondrus crispus]CDF33056.1 unnamed protein product [Chondrus crispus]|eukprot:XP_005712859.1 unnamed protein product [Chondrus crispus]
MNTKPWIRLLRHLYQCFEDNFSPSCICGTDEVLSTGESRKTAAQNKWASGHICSSLFLPPQRPGGRLLYREFFVAAHSSWGCMRETLGYFLLWPSLHEVLGLRISF